MSAGDPFAGLSASERALLRPAPLPQRVVPMAAVRTEERFSDPGWIYERKLDGIRGIAIGDHSGVRLLSRNDLSLDARFPRIAAALDQAARGLVLDGEIVAFRGSESGFALLQQRDERPVSVRYHAFDVLYAAGHDVTALPLRARKGVLRRALTPRGPVRRTAYRVGEGVALYEEACRRGWEGVVAKRADAPYVHRRSPDWLKFPCGRQQELVIGGFTAPRGSRSGLGALLLGHYDGGRLRYAGKVGTGFTRAGLEDLAARLAPLRIGSPPFADPVRATGATWVQPVLVAQVGFTEWTRDGRLRHPRFLGLRDDKAARDVVRE